MLTKRVINLKTMSVINLRYSSMKEDLIKVTGKRWMQVASNWSIWKLLVEAYVQQWTYCG